MSYLQLMTVLTKTTNSNWPFVPDVNGLEC